MDGGPFRSQRPAERRATNRPEPANWQPEEPQPIKEEAKTVNRTPSSYRSVPEEKPRRRFIFPLIGAIVLIAIIVIGWFVLSNNNQDTTAGIDKSKYQAVFFTNGQVYFGKLSPLNKDYMKLTDIYYLQTQNPDESEGIQQTATNQSNVQLIKLGEEVHGPEDEMIISKSQVLFFENLKTEGNVAQSIQKYKSSN